MEAEDSSQNLSFAEQLLGVNNMHMMLSQGICTRASVGVKISMENIKQPSETEEYSPEKCLGAGAFGEVWLAKDLKTKNMVALKVQTPSSEQEAMVGVCVCVGASVCV